MTRDELEAVIFEHADPRNILRGKSDGRAIRAALDEFAREQRAAAWDEGCTAGYYDAAGYAEAGPNPYREKGDDE